MWSALPVLAAFFLSDVCSSDVPTVKLNDGKLMPGYGFGTWLGISKEGGLEKVKDESVQKAVEAAIDTGYRHIDTAAIYETEEQVGRAINKKIADGVVKRDDVFVTTKLWNDKHARADVAQALRGSLGKLQLDYLDLYMVHWPFAHFPNMTFWPIDYLETWQGMVDAKEQGLTRSIGVCNFNKQQLERLIKESGVKPAVLQIEVNLNLQQAELIKYCKEQGIVVVGYTPFGSLFYSKARPRAPPPRVDDPALLRVASNHNKTVTQVVLRYLVELGVVPIPKTVTSSRVAENFQVFDFSLSEEERATLAAFDNGFRTIDVTFWKAYPYYPFEKN